MCFKFIICNGSAVLCLTLEINFTFPTSYVANYLTIACFDVFQNEGNAYLPKTQTTYSHCVCDAVEGRVAIESLGTEQNISMGHKTE